MRDESGTITAEQANKMIKEAERQKDETIKKANDQKDGIVKKIKEQNSEVLKNIDEGDGEIMSKWDSLMRWLIIIQLYVGLKQKYLVEMRSRKKLDRNKLLERWIDISP